MAHSSALLFIFCCSILSLLQTHFLFAWNTDAAKLLNQEPGKGAEVKVESEGTANGGKGTEPAKDPKGSESAAKANGEHGQSALEGKAAQRDEKVAVANSTSGGKVDKSKDGNSGATGTKGLRSKSAGSAKENVKMAQQKSDKNGKQVEPAKETLSGGPNGPARKTSDSAHEKASKANDSKDEAANDKSKHQKSLVDSAGAKSKVSRPTKDDKKGLAKDSISSPKSETGQASNSRTKSDSGKGQKEGKGGDVAKNAGIGKSGDGKEKEEREIDGREKVEDKEVKGTNKEKSAAVKETDQGQSKGASGKEELPKKMAKQDEGKGSGNETGKNDKNGAMKLKSESGKGDLNLSTGKDGKDDQSGKSAKAVEKQRGGQGLGEKGSPKSDLSAEKETQTEGRGGREKGKGQKAKSESGGQLGGDSVGSRVDGHQSGGRKGEQRMTRHSKASAGGGEEDKGREEKSDGSSGSGAAKTDGKSAKAGNANMTEQEEQEEEDEEDEEEEDEMQSGSGMTAQKVNSESKAAKSRKHPTDAEVFGKEGEKSTNDRPQKLQLRNMSEKQVHSPVARIHLADGRKWKLMPSANSEQSVGKQVPAGQGVRKSHHPEPVRGAVFTEIAKPRQKRPTEKLHAVILHPISLAEIGNEGQKHSPIHQEPKMPAETKTAESGSEQQQSPKEGGRHTESEEEREESDDQSESLSLDQSDAKGKGQNKRETKVVVPAEKEKHPKHSSKGGVPAKKRARLRVLAHKKAKGEANEKRRPNAKKVGKQKGAAAATNKDAERLKTKRILSPTHKRKGHEREEGEEREEEEAGEAEETEEEAHGGRKRGTQRRARKQPRQHKQPQGSFQKAKRAKRRKQQRPAAAGLRQPVHVLLVSADGGDRLQQQQRAAPNGHSPAAEEHTHNNHNIPAAAEQDSEGPAKRWRQRPLLVDSRAHVFNAFRPHDILRRNNAYVNPISEGGGVTK